MHLPFTPLVEKLPSSVPFVGPEALERRTGTPFRARIGANESVFGPSPKVIAAMRAGGAGGLEILRSREPRDQGGAGAAPRRGARRTSWWARASTGCSAYAVRLFVEPGVTVATSLGAYPTFNFHVHGFGGRLVTTPYVNDREDPASLLDLAKREKRPAHLLRQPGQPDGQLVGCRRRCSDFIDALPDGTLLMLDEAYGEFAPDGTLPPLDVSRPNVLRFRTFSKAYGMAGMRLGYCIGHADLISRLRQDPQPLRRHPHGPGGRRRRAGRSGPPAERRGKGDGRAGGDRAGSPAPTA